MFSHCGCQVVICIPSLNSISTSYSDGLSKALNISLGAFMSLLDHPSSAKNRISMMAWQASARFLQQPYLSSVLTLYIGCTGPFSFIPQNSRLLGVSIFYIQDYIKCCARATTKASLAIESSRWTLLHFLYSNSF